MTLATVASDLRDEITVIAFTGKFDDSNIEEKAAEVDAILADAPSKKIIFDFTEMEYLNSQTIGNLNRWYLELEESGGELKIAGAAGNVLDVLEMMALDQVIDFHPTVEAAEKAFLS